MKLILRKLEGRGYRMVKI